VSIAQISVYHHKPMPGALRVRLFKSARAKVAHLGTVSAELVHDDLPQVCTCVRARETCVDC
jgi:hypothetical protein